MAYLPVKFASRAGQKLEHAMESFGIDAAKLICADLGCNAGGFVDCLLRRDAAKVYAIDTGYGVLDWRLRSDPRVVTLERTNAMHVILPEPVDLVTIDVAWTRQSKILPPAVSLLKPTGSIVSLIKPHYEADRQLLRQGILPGELVPQVVSGVLAECRALGLEVAGQVESPIRGAQGNVEVLVWLKRPT